MAKVMYDPPPPGDRPPIRSVIHPPHGWIELEEYSASDLAVVNAARVSFDKYSHTMSEAEVGLIGYLMRNRHTSPFEHGMFRFVVRAPIFVLREWQRHRTWSYNEQSTRYVEMLADAYAPRGDRVRTQVGKPGAYVYEPLPNPDAITEEMEDWNRACWDKYQGLLAKGVAREVARNVLPLSLYSTMHATVDPLNLMRFLSLRNHPAALREIRDYAQVIEEWFAFLMPVTWRAFIANDRLGPRLED